MTDTTAPDPRDAPGRAAPARADPPRAILRREADVLEFFAPQRTSRGHLQDPTPLVGAIVRGLLEVLAGVREVEQLARWFTEEAYRVLATRASLAARARSARGRAPLRPVYDIRRVLVSSPADGVIEATAIVGGPARTRAVALRLEGIDRRWRVTSAALL